MFAQGMEAWEKEDRAVFDARFREMGLDPDQIRLMSLEQLEAWLAEQQPIGAEGRLEALDNQSEDHIQVAANPAEWYRNSCGCCSGPMPLISSSVAPRSTPAIAASVLGLQPPATVAGELGCRRSIGPSHAGDAPRPRWRGPFSWRIRRSASRPTDDVPTLERRRSVFGASALDVERTTDPGKLLPSRALLFIHRGGSRRRRDLTCP
jgi:hypothetical protein